MSDGRLFTVRPLTKQKSDLKDAFRVHLSSSNLASLKLRAGDLCSLQRDDGFAKTAIAWVALENIQNAVVQTSRTLQDCYGIKLGDKISITKLDEHLDNVGVILMEECTDGQNIAQNAVLSDDAKHHWEWALEYPLLKCEVVCVGLTIEVELRGERRSFKVQEIQSHGTCTKTIFRHVKSSSVRIGFQPKDNDARLDVCAPDLGGLSTQIREINACLADFDNTFSDVSMPSFYQPNRGILIYGPKGTGKTALLRAIAGAGWKQAFYINSSTLGRRNEEGEVKLRKFFQDALLSQPSVVVIDQLESIVPKRPSYDSATLAHSLSESLDSLKSAKVLVVGATRHPNDVDDLLRTPHRLAIEIELPVPTAQDRFHILHAIRGEDRTPDDKLLQWLSEKTHGYVGADLFALLQTACRKARSRSVDNSTHNIPIDTRHGSRTLLHQEMGDVISQSTVLNEEDFIEAMREIRPTAMREVFLETPKVKWSDIGGQQLIKRCLQRIVERPLKVKHCILV
jgi:AAA family ATPase